ncbi:MAG: histidinol-phosphate transaminase [Peptococcaceae bacterium]|nr:histidinol-phosphate transaminase [Peptococcaceae bacterium]
MTVKNRDSIMSIKPYVPGKPIDEVKRELGIDDVIKLASNENPLGPSEAAKGAMLEAACNMHIYPDGSSFYLKEAIAKKYNIQTENVIIGNGSDELIKLIAETYVNPEDEVVIGSPSFSEYIFATHLMGGKIVSVPLTADNRFDLAGMIAAITEKTKVIIICNPNNPTGTMVNKQEVNAFIAQVPEHILVVFDSAYAEYAEDDGQYESGSTYVIKYPNVIELRTFSKIYALAGLRVGYGIAAAETIAMISRTREPFNVNAMAQAAAIAALQDITHVEQSRKVNHEGKKYLYDQFQQMGLKYIPTHANFIMVDVEKDSKEVFQALMAKGVIVRTGDIFGMPTYLRVTIGLPEENERFIKALKEILKK